MLEGSSSGMKAIHPLVCLLAVGLAACADGGGTARPAPDGGARDTGAPDGALSDSGGPDGDGGLVCDGENEHLVRETAASASGDVSYVLDRCMWMICAGGCDVSRVSFSLTYGGRTDSASGDDIVYTRTHHNWNDSLVATLPDRVLEWRVAFSLDGGTLTPFVSVETRGGDVILPETRLFFDGTM